jgi:hypothetical protein
VRRLAARPGARFALRSAGRALHPARDRGRGRFAERGAARPLTGGRGLRAGPDDCLAAAFFDSLIGQQDRHRGNYRRDAGNEKLGLIDHGYAFAHLPDQYFNRSVFVEWRWDAARGDLTEAEREALEGLLASGDLHGLERFLLPEEAEALASRAKRMLERGAILDLGEF